MCPKLPLAYGYTNGLDTMRAVHTIQPRGIHRCLVFDKHFEIFLRFQNVKTKRSKRLSICLIAHTTHPQGMVAWVTNAKILLNSGFWIMNSELFARVIPQNIENCSAKSNAERWIISLLLHEGVLLAAPLFFNNSCQHPLAGFSFASKNMPKGVGRFFFCSLTTLS